MFIYLCFSNKAITIWLNRGMFLIKTGPGEGYQLVTTRSRVRGDIYIQDMHCEIMTPGPWIQPLVTKLHLTSHATFRFNNQAWIRLTIHTSNIQPMTARPRFQLVHYDMLHEYLIVFPSVIECLHRYWHV